MTKGGFDAQRKFFTYKKIRLASMAYTQTVLAAD
jgi:hypothetical protein